MDFKRYAAFRTVFASIAPLSLSTNAAQLQTDKRKGMKAEAAVIRMRSDVCVCVCVYILERKMMAIIQTLEELELAMYGGGREN